MSTSGPITTFWPMLQFSSIFELESIWKKCHILVPRPILTLSSIIADGCTKAPYASACRTELLSDAVVKFVWASKLVSAPEPSLTIRPLSFKEAWLAFRILSTFKPSCPSVIGWVPLDIQPIKCRHSWRKGSSCAISTLSGSALVGTGRFFSQLI